ncbi:MAG: rod shape-determining protein [Puniceicoccales bacterium]|jgi:rod shape-determining protein MreB|nr:rod shape-determining protein [Puniceicoccales bacterium]
MAFSFRSKIANFFTNFFGLWAHDIGIDLGTANTLVFVRDKGIVLREPSVVAIYATSRRVRAVGLEARKMLGRTPGSIITLRPMKDGVIADFEVTEAMLRYFISKVSSSVRLVPPRVIIAVPSGITEVEKRAVKEAAIHAGARDVLLIQEPMAAAIGVGLPIDEPAANMIVDIGGGTTEIAILSLNGVVLARSIRIGGDEMDHNIIDYVKREYNLIIGERTAEELKMKIGSASPLAEELSISIKGRDAVVGLPKTITINSGEIRIALRDAVVAIVNAAKGVLEQCPPELASDLVDRGIVLAGGGAMLRNLDLLMSEETGLPVIVASDPLSAVANGTGTVLQDLSIWFDDE